MIHTNRNDRQNLRNTYGLSAALRQVARRTLYAAEDPNTSALLVGPDKSNLGKRGVAERFERTSVQLWTPTQDNDGTVARLDHLGSDSRTIAEALSRRVWVTAEVNFLPEWQALSRERSTSSARAVASNDMYSSRCWLPGTTSPT